MNTGLIKPPFVYLGAKTKLLEWIYSFFPSHVTYVDVFGGSGVVLLNKLPSKNEVYNDVNCRLVNFYKVLRDEYKRKELQDLIQLTPYAREEVTRCETSDTNDVEDARRFYVSQNVGFSGVGSAFGYTRSTHNNKITRFYDTDWREVVSRMREVHIENLPFERIFKNYDSPGTLFYCDPPYVDTADYEKMGVSYGPNEHKSLVKCLLEMKGMALLSNYENDLNLPLLEAGWSLEKKEFTCTLANTVNDEGRSKDVNRVECLYLSPSVIRDIRSRFLFM